MPRSRDRQSARATLAALTIAVLAHAAFLMLPLPRPAAVENAVRPAPLTIEILARAPAARLDNQAAPLERDEAPEPPPPISRQADAAAAPTPALSGTRPGPEETTETSVTTADTASAEELRTRLIEAAGEIGRGLEGTDDEPALEYARIPDLPGRTGWLQRYTGRVAPSVDRWRSNDGSQSARFVTSSGRVVCSHTRAPTIDEIFNPWASSAVPMMRDCGRERPTPDTGDPWLRRPAPAGGED